MSASQIVEQTMPAYFSDEDLSIEALEAHCARSTDPAAYPLAATVEKNIPIYEGAAIRTMLDDPARERALRAELVRLLRDGPGVFVVSGAFGDTAIVDRATEAFREIVAAEEAAGSGQGDHFGSNQRIWNSIQKVAVRYPELFIDYYGNPIIALASEVWLGPHYQISAQMNNVRPGNQAQSIHRDYHLGFQSPETVARFPAHAQVMSQYLTLQGAVAHTDMPLESGPTRLLPFSHHFRAGYQAYTRPEFQRWADERMVQIPFAKGDMVYFSPALFHGAGTNQAESDRIANLLQISSAFGRTMETIDNRAMVFAIYPALLARVEAGSIGERRLRDTIAAVADGYSFPTNLDSDPPVGGNAPETGQQLLRRALDERWSPKRVHEMMRQQAERRRA